MSEIQILDGQKRGSPQGLPTLKKSFLILKKKANFNPEFGFFREHWMKDHGAILVP